MDEGGELLNLHDYARAAEARTPVGPWEYFAGGAGDALGLDENRRAWSRWLLRPRVLRDVSSVSTAAKIGGRETALPVLLAPTAMHGLAHPEGELATARGAKAAGAIQVLSTMSSRSIEEVAATGVDLWFQLYVFPDRAGTERLVRRAEAAGARALALTVDVPRLGLRENLLRVGFEANLPLPNLDDDAVGLLAGIREFDPSLSWADLRWLVGLTELPVWVKGLLRADDARTALEHGAAGVVVSNHGARQLDGTVAPVDALPEIVEAVGGHAGVLVDGGVRRGTDVLKALALGADGVLIGRPQLHGLCVGGARGVTRVLELLRAELANDMAQCGARDVAEVTRDLVLRAFA